MAEPDDEMDNGENITLGTSCEVTLLATTCNPALVLQFPNRQVIWNFHEVGAVIINSFNELFNNYRFPEKPFKWVSLGQNAYHLVEIALQGLSEKLTMKLIKCDIVLSPEYSSNAIRILEQVKCKKIRVEAMHDPASETFNRLCRAADGTEELVLNVQSNSLAVVNSVQTDIVRINKATWVNNNSLFLLNAKQIHLNRPSLSSIDVRMFLSAWASRDMRLEVLEIRHEGSLVLDEIKFGLISQRIDRRRKFQQHKICFYLNDSTDRVDIISCNGAKTGSMFFSNTFFIFLAC